MSIDYCTLTDVKKVLGVTNGTQDDAYIETIITRVSREIENITKRKFYAYQQTRYFNPLRDILKGRTLLLDEDLSYIISVTNGDNTVLPDSAYVTESPNYTPYWGITLLAGSGKAWLFRVNPENAIAVNGSWGYVNGTTVDTVPTVVRQAAALLTKFRYQRGQAGYAGNQGLPAAGNEITIMPDIPGDIRGMLTPYVKPYTFSYATRRY